MRTATCLCVATVLLAAFIPGDGHALSPLPPRSIDTDAAASPAGGQGGSENDADMAAAKALFEEGEKLYGEGWFCEAFHKFGEAYEKYDNKAFLWNMALCQLRLGHRDEVLKHLNRFLNESGRQREAPPMAEAMRLLSETPEVVPECDRREVLTKLVAAQREAEVWAQQQPAEEASKPATESEEGGVESSKRAYALFEEARTLEAGGEFDAAAAKLEEAAGLETNSDFLVALARVHILAGKRDAAHAALGRLLDALGLRDERNVSLVSLREALATQDEPIPEEERAGLVHRLTEAYGR